MTQMREWTKITQNLEDIFCVCRSFVEMLFWIEIKYASPALRDGHWRTDPTVSFSFKLITIKRTIHFKVSVRERQRTPIYLLAKCVRAFFYLVKKCWTFLADRNNFFFVAPNYVFRILTGLSLHTSIDRTHFCWRKGFASGLRINKLMNPYGANEAEKKFLNLKTTKTKSHTFPPPLASFLLFSSNRDQDLPAAYNQLGWKKSEKILYRKKKSFFSHIFWFQLSYWIFIHDIN